MYLVRSVVYFGIGNAGWMDSTMVVRDMLGPGYAEFWKSLNLHRSRF